MKNPTLKLLTFAITGLALGFLPNAAKAQSEYFGSSAGLANDTAYSWDAANWGNGSAGPFVNVWTNGDFARFYGGGGLSYTVTVNQAESNIGLYNDNSSSTLTIQDAGNGTGNLEVITTIQGFLSTLGSITIINCPITGNGGIAPELSGSIYLNATNTYSGGTALGDSGNTLTYFDNNSAFSTNSITLNRTGIANFSTLLGYGGSALTISNNFSITSGAGGGTSLNFADAVNTPVTSLGTWTLGTNNLNLRTAGGSTAPLTLSGLVSGTGTLFISANPGGDNTPGATVLSAVDSGFTGNIEVTGATNSIGSTTYGGNTNAILQLGVADAIAAAKGVVLAGGTLNGGGFNHVNTATLDVTNNTFNTIYFGGGSMSFASSSTQPWSGVLDLADWTGTGSTYGGTQFRIGTSASGLTFAQLGLIEFNNNPATMGNAAIDPNGYIYDAATAPGPTFSVTAANSLISQANSYGNVTTTTFTITRGGSLAGSLTVNYTLTGKALGATAGSGLPGFPATVTVTPSSGTAVFAANQTVSNITVTAISDSIARPTTRVILTLSTSSSYNLVAPTTASVTVLNTAPDELFASAVDVPSMYKAFSNDYSSIILTRWGDTNAAAYSVNTFSYSGTAVEGTDFGGTNAAAPSVTINPGDLTDTVYFSPWINGQPAVDTNNLPYTGNKTIIASVANGSGYTGSTNTALLTIIDNQNPPATYLYQDPLNQVADSNNWAVTSANDNMQYSAIDDYVDFGYDLFGDPRDPAVMQEGGQTPIPFPPNGATNALRLTVNKSSAEGSGAAGAVNLYLTNAFFSGNYAVRFNMNLVEGFETLYTTEGALFGFNHNGQATNWWAGSGLRSGWTPTVTNWESDGIWCWVNTDSGVGGFDGGPSDYFVLTGNGGKLPNTGFALPPLGAASKSTLVNNFKSAVFTSPQGPGLAANNSPDNTSSSEDSSWSDVELKQYNNIVTLSIDKTTICTFTNKTSFTNGYVMFGYEDPYDSVGGGDAAVYYSNLRVVRLSPPALTEAALNGGTYVFDFTSTDGDATPASFQIVGSTVVNGTYTVVTGATITQLGNGAYQASVPISGPIQFYKIQQTL